VKHKAYPEYKGSGVEWLGDVPEHWGVKPLKYVASVNDEVLPESTPSDWELIYVDIGSVDRVEGITKKESMIFENAPSRARRLVSDGDTIVSTVRTYLRAIAPVQNPEPNLVVSTGFAVIRARKIRSDYLSFLLRSGYFIENVVLRSVGVSYPATNATEVVKIPILIPIPSEQIKIATFLNIETKKIDSLVSKKRALIEKVREKRTAIISRTVTRGLPPEVARAAGLDPHLKLKPSGVEWLGEIPEHWETKRVKSICSIFGRIGYRGYTTDDLVDEGGGALSIGAGHVTLDGYLNLDNPVFISWQKYHESPEIMVAHGDVLVAQRGSCGKVALIDGEIGPATINPSMVVLKNLRIHGDFLWYWLLGDFVQGTFKMYLSATAVPMISQQQIGNVPICIPPSDEQNAIVRYLRQETAKIDQLIIKVEAAIERLQEYRTALITAAVTGKIDVRETQV
jgi:type I restriction enzyme, S subunit